MENLEHLRQITTDALAKFGGFNEALAWLQIQTDVGALDEAVADLCEAGCYVPQLAALAAALRGGLARDQEVARLTAIIASRDAYIEAQERVIEGLRIQLANRG